MMMDLFLGSLTLWLFWSRHKNTKLCIGMKLLNITLSKQRRSQNPRQLILLIIQLNLLKISIFKNNFWLKNLKIWMKNTPSLITIWFLLKYCLKANRRKAKMYQKVHLLEEMLSDQYYEYIYNYHIFMLSTFVLKPTGPLPSYIDTKVIWWWPKKFSLSIPRHPMLTNIFPLTSVAKGGFFLEEVTIISPKLPSL